MSPPRFLLLLFTVAIGLLDALYLSSNWHEDRVGALAFPLLAAQASLLAWWLVLGAGQFWPRLMVVLPGLLLLAHLQAVSSAHTWHEWLWVFSIIALTTMLTQAAWRLVAERPLPWLPAACRADRPLASRGWRQFQLRDIFLSLTGTAIVLGFGRWLGPPTTELRQILGMAICFGILASVVFGAVVYVRHGHLVLATIAITLVTSVPTLVAARFGWGAVDRGPLLLGALMLVLILSSVVALASLAWRCGRESLMASTAPAVRR